MLKILGRSSSSNVQKVLWCAAELGLDFTHEQEYGGAFGNTDTPEYLSMNPNGLVPTLVEDDFVLWESNAIVRYLAARHGQDSLYPSDLRARASAEKWMEWHTSTFGEVSFPAFFELVRKSAGERDQSAIDASVERTNKTIEILDNALSGRDYIGSETFSIADFTYGPTLHRWFNLSVERAPRPNVEAWYQRMLEREPFTTYVAIPLA